MNQDRIPQHLFVLSKKEDMERKLMVSKNEFESGYASTLRTPNILQKYAYPQKRQCRRQERR